MSGDKKSGFITSYLESELGNSSKEEEPKRPESLITQKFLVYLEKLKQPLFKFGLVLAGITGLKIDDVLKTFPTDFENELSLSSSSLIELIQKVVNQLTTSKSNEELLRNQIILRSVIDSIRDYKIKMMQDNEKPISITSHATTLTTSMTNYKEEKKSSSLLQPGFRISGRYDNDDQIFTDAKSPKDLVNYFKTFLIVILQDIEDYSNRVSNRKKGTRLIFTNLNELKAERITINKTNNIQTYSKDGINSMSLKEYDSTVDDWRSWVLKFTDKLKEIMKNQQVYKSFPTKFIQTFDTIKEQLKNNLTPGDEKIPVDYLEYIFIYVLFSAYKHFRDAVNVTSDQINQVDSWNFTFAYKNIEPFIQKIIYIKYKTDFNLLEPDEKDEQTYNAIVKAFDYLEELNNKSFFKEKYKHDWRDFDEMVLLAEPFHGLCLMAQQKINMLNSCDFTLREYIWSEDSSYYFALYVKSLYLESKPNTKTITNENVQLTTVYGHTKYQILNNMYTDLAITSGNVFGGLKRFYMADTDFGFNVNALSSWSLNLVNENGNSVKRTDMVYHPKYATVLINVEYRNRMKLKQTNQKQERGGGRSLKRNSDDLFDGLPPQSSCSSVVKRQRRPSWWF